MMNWEQSLIPKQTTQFIVETLDSLRTLVTLSPQHVVDIISPTTPFKRLDYVQFPHSIGCLGFYPQLQWWSSLAAVRMKESQNYVELETKPQTPTSCQWENHRALIKKAHQHVRTCWLKRLAPTRSSYLTGDTTTTTTTDQQQSDS